MAARTWLIGAAVAAFLASAGGTAPMAGPPQGRVPLQASGDDLAPLVAAIAGYRIGSFGPYQVDGALTFGPNGIAIEDLVLDAGPPAASFALTGDIRDLRTRPTYDMRLVARGDGLASYSPLFGQALPSTPPLDLDVRMTRRSGLIELSPLVLNLGRSTLTGNLTIDPATRPARIAGLLQSPMLDLAELVANGASADPSRQAAPEWLQMAEGTVSVQADRVVLPDRTLRDVMIDLEIKDGTVTALPYALRLLGAPGGG